MELPAGTTKCCNGTFIATRKDLVKIGHQEPVYFSPAHAEVYVHRNPVEGRFGTDQQKGAYEPRSCRAPLLQAHAIASLVFDAIGNLQLTMNKEIEELYELIDNYGTPTEPADTEPADTEPADTEPADTEPADKKQDNSKALPTAVLGPRYETTIGNSPERDHRALAA